MKKRIKLKASAIIMSLTMTCTITPMMAGTVHAEEEFDAMVMGAYELYRGSNTSEASTICMADEEWRVIGYFGTGVSSRSGTATLISSDGIGNVAFNALEAGNNYSGSNLQIKTNELIEGDKCIFTAEEKEAIVPRTLEGGSGNFGSDTYDGNKIAGDSVADAKLWSLSASEAESMNEDLRKTAATDLTNYYWRLRTPGNDNNCAAYVSSTGFISKEGTDVNNADYLLRPAFNLNLKSILFTSAAEGGKLSEDGKTFTKVGVNSTNKWKMTLLDSDRNLNVKLQAIDGSVRTISWSDAKTGEKEYLSALIKDHNGTIDYYGRLKNLSDTSDAAGTIQIDLDGINMTGKTLYVFNEEYNGDSKTDYSSALKEVSTIPVSAGLKQITFDDLNGKQEDYIYFGTYPQSKMTHEQIAGLKENKDYVISKKGGYYRIEPIKWRVMGKQGDNYLLLADKLLDKAPYNSELASVTWSTCSLRTQLNGDFYTRTFSEKEQSQIAETANDDVKDNVFLLSEEEVKNTNYGFIEENEATDTRVALTTGYYEAVRDASTTLGVDFWWLRSPGSDGTKAVISNTSGVLRKSDGDVNKNTIGVRPAISIQGSNVLFKALADGGKDAETGAIKEVGESTSGKEWRLTLLDGERKEFKAEESYREDNKRVVFWSGAKTGKNEYISIIIKDDSTGEITHYGRLRELTRTSEDVSSKVTIDFDGIDTSGKSIYVFNEHYDSNEAADYSSKLVKLKGSKTVIPTGKTLTYTGKAQKGVDEGAGYTLSGTTSATNAGSYKATATLKEGYIWSDGTTAAKSVTWKINKATVKVAVPTGKTFTYNGKTKTGVVSGTGYKLTGKIKAYTAGTYTAKATLSTNANYIYKWKDGTTAVKTIKWTIKKAANPLSIKAKTATVKYDAVKKKAQTLAVGKVINFTKKGQGKMTYTKVSGNKNITINKTTGKVTVKKGLKKGTYKVKIKAKAAGNVNYKASAFKTVTFTIKVN